MGKFEAFHNEKMKVLGGMLEVPRVLNSEQLYMFGCNLDTCSNVILIVLRIFIVMFVPSMFFT